ncbi:MAG TPA: alpha/beta hydrolase [Xanthobacteraceae bacterium]|jgi:arylformamidase|nr:alpha/beta hydrolase [Xanthobacteraceae bacterium]
MIDYEVEYNNRARVPEHAEIFARWRAAAAAYRAHMKAEENAELGLAYGTSPRQTVDLFFPEATGHTPLALFIHGGYWRSLEASTFSHMAAGLNAKGVAVAVAGYDLCPQVTIGQIVNQIRNACLFLWRRFGQRLMVYGHSAGGHLSGCMLATDWRKFDPKAPADLVPAAYSISGLFDLAPLVHTAMNSDLRLDEVEVARVSPLSWPVSNPRVFDAVVGGAESSEFLRQSRVVVDTWRAKGVDAHYVEVPGANHFTVIDPLTDPASAMTARCAALAAKCAKVEK